MNVALFLANRMRRQKQYKSSVSSRIIKIATASIVVGMTTILIAVAVTKGLQKTIRSQAVAFNGHISVSRFENNESKVSTLPMADSKEVRTLMQSHPKVLHVHGVALKEGIFRTPDNFEGFLFKGVENNFEWKLLELFLMEGNFPSFQEGSLSNDILISSVHASRLGLTLGDSVNAFFQSQKENGTPSRRKFTVVGIYFSGFPDIDENLVYGDLKQVQRLQRWERNQIGNYEVFVEDMEDVNAVGAYLNREMTPDKNVALITEQYADIFQWISLFDFNTLIIIAMMVLVGVINMATALLALILERARMIGLLKTLGAQNTLIQRVFLYNGLIIMAKGLFWGNVLGAIFYFSQKYWGWVTLDPSTYFVKTVPVSITTVELFILNSLVLLVTTFLLWFPSKIIMKMNPSKVFRLR